MKVKKPFYRLGSADTLLELNWEEAVKTFYKELVDAHTTVMLLEHETTIVSDWGFASQAHYHTFMTAQTAIEQGHEVNDPNGKYIESRWVCMMWPYDTKSR